MMYLLKNKAILLAVAVLVMLIYKKLSGAERKEIVRDTIVTGIITAFVMYIMSVSENVSSNSYRMSGDFNV